LSFSVRVIRDAEIYTPVAFELRRHPPRCIEYGAEQQAELMTKFERQARTLRNRQTLEADALYAEQVPNNYRTT
jgi:hypothetical protein